MFVCSFNRNYYVTNNLIKYKIDPELRKISGNIMLEYGNEIGIFKNKKQKND